MVASGRVTKEPLSLVALHDRSYGATVSIHYLQLAVGGNFTQTLFGQQLRSIPEELLYGSPLDGAPGILPAMHLIHSLQVPSPWEEVVRVAGW